MKERRPQGKEELEPERQMISRISIKEKKAFEYVNDSNIDVRTLA